MVSNLMDEYIKKSDIGLTDFEIILCKGDYKEALLMLFDKIEHLPAADVRPVMRGKWIWKDNGEVVCSECNDLIAVVGNTEDLETVISGFNFCPNCGAMMEEI